MGIFDFGGYGLPSSADGWGATVTPGADPGWLQQSMGLDDAQFKKFGAGVKGGIGGFSSPFQAAKDAKPLAPPAAPQAPQLDMNAVIERIMGKPMASGAPVKGKDRLGTIYGPSATG